MLSDLVAYPDSVSLHLSSSVTASRRCSRDDSVFLRAAGGEFEVMLVSVLTPDTKT